jgi:hypothetical protein
MNFDTAWLTAEKLHRLMADTNDLAIVAIDGNDGRLVQEDSPVGLIDEGVNSTQIDGQFVLKELLNELHGDDVLLQIGRAQKRVMTSGRQLVCLTEERFLIGGRL